MTGNISVEHKLRVYTSIECFEIGEGGQVGLGMVEIRILDSVEDRIVMPTEVWNEIRKYVPNE